MNKIICSVLLVLGLCATSHATGWERSIRVEWDYISPADLTVAEFRLYQDEEKVCTWPGATVRAGGCKVMLQKSATPFTLEAAFTSGGVSTRSNPFTFADFGAGPSIMILSGK